MMFIRRLCAKLFGWEYWAFKFAYGIVIRRAYLSPGGKRYCIYLGSVVDLDEPYRAAYKII
jgi:hypothetical protein